MGHAFWKLTSLVGISGLGFLILLQAQQGVQNSREKSEAKSIADHAEGDEARAAGKKPSTPRPSTETSGRVHLADHEHHADHNHHAHPSDGDSANPATATPANPFATNAPSASEEMTPVTQREAATEETQSAVIAANDEPAAEASPFGEPTPTPIAQASFEDDTAEPQPFRREVESELELSPEPEPATDAIAEASEGSLSDAPAFLGEEGTENDTEETPTPDMTETADFGPDPFAAFGAPPEPEGAGPSEASEPELAPGPTPAPAGANLEESVVPGSAPAGPIPAENAPVGETPIESAPAETDPTDAAAPMPEVQPGDAVPFDSSMDEPSSEPVPEPTSIPLAEEGAAETPMPNTSLPDPFGGSVPLEPEPTENEAAPLAESAPPELAETEPAADAESAMEAEPAADADPFASFEDDPFAELSAVEETNSGEEEAETEPDAPAPAGEPPVFGGGTAAGDPVEPSPPAEETEPAEPAGESPFAIEDDPFGTAPEQPAPMPATEPLATDESLNAPPVEPEMSAEPLDPPMDEMESPLGAPSGIEARPEPLAGSDEPEPAASGLPIEPELATPDAETPQPFPMEDAGEEGAVADGVEDVPMGNPPTIGGLGTVVTETPRDPQTAQLTVEKKAPARATIGEPVVYEVIVTNVGESPAHEVTVADMVPQGATLNGTIPQAIMKDHRLTWKLGTLQPAESSTIRIQVVPTAPGSIGSVATVNFVSEVAAETEIVAPKLVLRLSAPETVALGRPVDFRFEIANEGNAPAEDVILRDVLPAGFRHVDGNDLEYEVGTLPPGAVEQVTLRVATVKAGEYSNQAVLTGKGGLKAEASATVSVTGQQVSLIRKGPKQRFVGRPAIYTNVVRNNSDEPVASAKVIETIPAGMEFIRASQGGQYNPQERTVAWQVGPLAPGEEKTVEVTLTASTEGAQDSVVRVEEIGGSHVQVSSTTKVASPGGLASAIEGLDRPVIIGERAAFQIRLENQGATAAEEVLISLVLPAQLRFIEARGGEAFPSTRGVTTVRTDEPIPPGGEVTIEFVVEGIAAGEAKLRASIHAAQLSNPLVQEANLRVVAARS